MADKVSFSIDFGELAGYTPVEGIGTSSLLAKDGFYSLTINKVTLGKSKDAGNPKLILSCTVQDEDEKGASLIADVLCGGKDKNGNPLARQLGDLFHSMGLTAQQVQALAANGMQDGDKVAQSLVGKTVFGNVEAETYNGNTTSRVRGWIGKQRYADAVAANAHRKPRKADVSFTGAPAGVTPSTATNGAAKPAAASVNPLDRLSGLNLPI